ncbi:hypothetical protein CN605_02265 [Bacillus toyonensis]|uniref:hypothetical protein n=1 Tax=Bacillus toyonensis TaxID=155322 RepID=UPI000BF06B04|nr:hypothetical protein [Bacillus toyonensis]PEL49577.1 hypothetical protein CN605_02265 [Bacillus toyonensis]
MKKQGKDDRYIFLLMVIGILFFWISFISFHMSSLKWNDIFAGACSLAGGILTVIGVQMTIVAQRKQESLKLVPSKILALHKLRKVNKEYRKSFENNVIKQLISHFDDLGIPILTEHSQGYVKNLPFISSKLNDYRMSLYEEEIKFVELASKVDIEVYEQVKSIFESIDKKMRDLISFKEWEREDYTEVSEFLQTHLNFLQMHVTTELMEFNKYLDRKLKDYGKETLL